MKKLIILLTLISFNTFSYDTHQEIDAVQVNDVLRNLLFMEYAGCEYTATDGVWIFENIQNVLDTPECEPDLSVLETRLEAWKVNQKEILDYRLLLAEKKLEAKNKFIQIRPHFHLALQKAGLIHISNPDAWFRDKVKRINDVEKIETIIIKLDSLINQLPSIQAEIDAQNEASSLCNINVSAVQNFDVNSIDTMDVTQLKNVIKNMAKIIQCRIK